MIPLPHHAPVLRNRPPRTHRRAPSPFNIRQLNH